MGTKLGAKLVLLLALAAAHSPLISASPAHNTLPVSLQSCLEKSGADTIYPGDPNYNPLSKPQNSNYHAHPEVIVVPSSTEQVSSTIKCVAAENGNIKLTPRGGGHGYAAYSFAGQVLIDSSRMKGISVNRKKNEATVHFGQTLGPMATAIAKEGYALPHGTCPTVGVAGHALGGGWGYASRKWGWLVDRIVSLEFVDINGDIKWLSPSSTGRDADLWWALRGAGSNNFGVVTTFTFALEKAPAKTVNYELYFGPEPDCAKVLMQVQELGRLPASHPDGLPAGLGVEIILIGRDSDQDSACILQGQYIGKKAGYQTAINKILSRLAKKGIKPIQSETMVKEFSSWITALTEIMNKDTDEPLPYYAQSNIDSGSPNYNEEQVKLIFDGLRAARKVKGSEPDVSFDLLGPGAKTNLPAPSGDMAFIHRHGLFFGEVYSAYFPGFNESAAHEMAVKQISDITRALRLSRPASEWHSYQNYIDPNLKDFGWEYYGHDLPRLKALKAVADPDNVFDFPQGLNHA